MRRHDLASESASGLAHYIKEYLRHNEQLVADRGADHCTRGVVQHQRRKEAFQSASTRKDRTTSRTPAGNISTTSSVPIETRSNSTHDAERLRRGTQTKPRLYTSSSPESSWISRASTDGIWDPRASKVGSLLETTLRAGVRKRVILAPSPLRRLDPTSSGGSRFYASVCDAAVARSKLAKKEPARYQPSLAQIKETRRHTERREECTVWQNTWIIVLLALVPVFLLVACLVLVIVLDDEALAASNAANITTSKIPGDLVWDANWNTNDMGRLAVLLQVLVLPYIFPTPFGLIVASFQTSRKI